jgi:hypothetical protein
MTHLHESHPDTIVHYHGDIVRMLFLATVGLAFVAVPFWGYLLPFGMVFEVASGIVLILLAGLTSPHSKVTIVLDAIAAALGAFLLEITAISFRSVDPIMLQIIREACALALLGAMYFSIKTLRAMMQGNIGILPRPWEFEEDQPDEERKTAEGL